VTFDILAMRVSRFLYEDFAQMLKYTKYSLSASFVECNWKWQNYADSIKATSIFSVRASCRTGCKRTGSLRRMSVLYPTSPDLNPPDFHVWDTMLKDTITPGEA